MRFGLFDMCVLELLHTRQEVFCSSANRLCSAGTAAHLKSQLHLQHEHLPYLLHTTHHAHSAASYPLLLYLEDKVHCLPDTLQQL